MKCWECGEVATKRRNIGTIEIRAVGIEPFKEYNQRCYCDECYEKVTAKRLRELKEYAKLRKKMMFERAVDILEHQKLNLYAYKPAIDAVCEYVEEKPDKFDSSYEMIAAIILIDNAIVCIPQHRIGKYQVDFYLPEERVVLEIDGERHNHRKQYDSERDLEIKKILGKGWEIVRIKAEYLDKHADMLAVAIDEVVRRRKSGL